MTARLIERTWWTILLQGALSILFGVTAIAWTNRTLSAMIGLFAVLALVSGTVSLVRAFSPPGVGTTVLLLHGLVGLAAGVVALLWPDMTAIVLVYVIAAWVVCLSLLQIGLAFLVRGGGLVLAGSGLIGLIFGAWLAVSPGEGAVAIVWLLGASMIVWGATLVAAGWRYRKLFQRLEGVATLVAA